MKLNEVMSVDLARKFPAIVEVVLFLQSILLSMLELRGNVQIYVTGNRILISI